MMLHGTNRDFQVFLRGALYAGKPEIACLARVAREDDHATMRFPP